MLCVVPCSSANLDRFSILTNHELAVEARMPTLNAQLVEQFQEDFSNSHEILLDEWTERSFSHRILEKTCAPFHFLM